MRNRGAIGWGLTQRLDTSSLEHSAQQGVGLLLFAAFSFLEAAHRRTG